MNAVHLRERLRTIISLAAAVPRGSSLRPVEIPVPVLGDHQAHLVIDRILPDNSSSSQDHRSDVVGPVSVSSLAGVAIVLGRRLSPHSVVVP